MSTSKCAGDGFAVIDSRMHHGSLERCEARDMSITVLSFAGIHSTEPIIDNSSTFVECATSSAINSRATDTLPFGDVTCSTRADVIMG